MATRSYIAYQDKDGVFHYRYHHWDGYPDGVGKTLVENFNNQKSIEKLFNMNANFSTINRPKEDIKNKPENFTNYRKKVIGNRAICAFKDEKAEDVEKQKTKTIADLIVECNEEFLYVYMGNKWMLIVSEQNILDLEDIIKISDLSSVLNKIEKKKVLERGVDYIVKENMVDMDIKAINYYQDYVDFNLKEIFKVAVCKKDAMEIGKKVKSGGLKEKKDKI